MISRRKEKPTNANESIQIVLILFAIVGVDADFVLGKRRLQNTKTTKKMIEFAAAGK
jgi:hypothetical protein